MTNTQLTQMALSAIVRCNEQITVFELNYILRGKSTHRIRLNGFDKIKTFGVGNIYSKNQWHYLFIQMIQQELFDIDYDDSCYLKVTDKGRQVLKGEIEVTDLKTGQPASLTFTKNGLTIQIEDEISGSVDWKKLINSLNEIVYWNYTSEKRLDVNNIIPPDTYERDKVKKRYLELAQQIFNLSIDGEEIIIPQKVDHDIYGNIVQPLSKPFDDCLEQLRQFIETTGRYPQMKAVSEEAALRKWYREVGHGIMIVTQEQKEKFNKFSEQYPMSKYRNKD